MVKIQTKNILFFSIALSIIIFINLSIILLGSIFPADQSVITINSNFSIFEINLWYIVVIFTYCMMTMFYLKNKNI